MARFRHKNLYFLKLGLHLKFHSRQPKNLLKKEWDHLAGFKTFKEKKWNIDLENCFFFNEKELLSFFVRLNSIVQ